MSTQVKTRADDTRVRIMDAAEALFRRLGFGKTAVADIAAELRMSPANVYRFFSSKNAIVEAICQRCLGELEEKAWAAARSRGSAAERIERLVLPTLAYHKENHLTDQRDLRRDLPMRNALRIRVNARNPRHQVGEIFDI